MSNSSAFDRARQLIPVNNLMGCQFLTRACPMKCSYCGIVNSPLRDKILRGKQWPLVFETLDKLGITFNLILGNEVLYLGDDLVELVAMMKGGTPYALYTTAPAELWEPLKQPLIDAGLQNLSMGCDYPSRAWDFEEELWGKLPDAEQRIKSKRAYETLKWAKEQGVPDTQATATLTRRNIAMVEEIAFELSEFGIWTAVNPVHYDKDGRAFTDGFDFFPPYEAISDLIVQSPWEMRRAIDAVKRARDYGGALVFNDAAALDLMVEFFDTSWHCTRPNVMTVDPDGRMRVCGYRRGRRCNEMSILEFVEDPEAATLKWLDAWKRDMLECPGCFWVMWVSAEAQDIKGAEESQRYFGQHGAERVDKEKWADTSVGTKGEGPKVVPHVAGDIPMVVKRGDWDTIRYLVEDWKPGCAMPPF